MLVFYAIIPIAIASGLLLCAGYELTGPSPIRQMESILIAGGIMMSILPAYILWADAFLVYGFGVEEGE